LDALALDNRAPLRHAARVPLLARALPFIVAGCLLPCQSALAATPAKAKHPPKPPAPKGHIGIGSAWGPVVVTPSHLGSH
jgi:Spy/CpxP family protein refolding chaperone